MRRRFLLRQPYVVRNVFVLLVVICAGIAVVYSGGLSHRIAQKTADALHEATGWDVSVERAFLSGPSRLTFRDVHIVLSADDAARYGVASVEADQVTVGVSWMSVASSGTSPGDWIRTMTWTAPRLRMTRSLTDGFAWPGLAASSKTTSSRERAVDSLSAPSKKTNSTRIKVHVIDGKVYDPEQTWGVHASGEGDVHDVRNVFVERLRVVHEPTHTEVVLSMDERDAGSVWRWHAEGSAEVFTRFLSVAGLTIDGTFQAFGRHDPRREDDRRFSVRIVDGSAAGIGPTAAERLDFDEFYVLGGYGEGIAVDEMKLVAQENVIRGRGRLERSEGSLKETTVALDVTADRWLFTEETPIIHRYGLKGEAAFHGTIEGTLAAPRLQGRLTLRDGTVWHRPVDRGEGDIILSAHRFSFEDVVLHRGDAAYDVNGAWYKEDAIPHLTITLNGRSGRVEDVLAVLGGGGLPIQGVFDGTLTFAGPTGDLRGRGTIESRDVVVFDRYIDALAGAFTWDGKQGEGTLHDGLLRFGPSRFIRPSGKVVVNSKAVVLDDVRLRAGDLGEYVLNGSIFDWSAAGDATLNVKADVFEASLSTLFMEGGLDVPARLLDGIVEGGMTLEGTLQNPDARFDLSLKDETDDAKPLRLRFQRVDGRIKFDGLSALLQAMNL